MIGDPPGLVEGPIAVPEDRQSEILNIFNSSSVEQRLFLISLFGSEFLPLNITERVKSFENACEVLNVDPASILALTFPSGTPENTLAFIKLSIVVKALNENWFGDMTNPNQRKYHVIPTLENGSFVYTAFTYVTTSASVPENLLLASEELIRYLSTQFVGLLDEYYSVSILQ